MLLAILLALQVPAWQGLAMGMGRTTLVPEDSGHALELPGGRMLARSAVVLGFICSPSSALFPHLSVRTPRAR